MLRLFDTGKLEENRLVADLNSIGVDVQPFDIKTGRQFRMEMFGGHFGGSLDGICIGIVEAPKTWHVLEMKTHNDKSFNDLCKKGVKAAKYEHWCQMQTYMGMSQEQPDPNTPIPAMNRSYYFAVNKNTDLLYAERVEYDGAAYLTIKEKARRVIFSATPPPKISNKSDFYQCKWCNFNKVCHNTNDAQEYAKADKNCRTCIYSTPQADGRWFCEKFQKNLCRDEQVRGCERHLFLPQLLPFKQVDATDSSVVYDDGMGNTITNFEGGELVTTIGRCSDAQSEQEKENTHPIFGYKL